MKKDFFYKWHQSSLTKHSTEVDVDLLWAAIEPAVDEINNKRKRRRGFFFFLSFVCVSVISIGFISLFIPTTSPYSARMSSDRNMKVYDSKQGIQIDAISIDNNKSTADKTAADALPSSSNTQTSSNTVSSSSIISPAKTVRNDYPKEKTSKHFRSLSTSKVPVKIYEPTPNEKLSVAAKSASVKTTINNEGAISDIIISNDDIRKALVVTDRLPIDFNPFLRIDPADDKKLPTAAIDIESAPKFTFSVGVYSGLAFAQKTLEQKFSTDSDEVFILREGTESSLEVWTNGVTGKAKHKSGLSLAAGVQYVKIAERMQYDTDYLLMDSIANQVIGYSNNLLGSRSTIYGFEPNNTLFDLEYNFYNNYHLLEIPISIGYQKQLENWNLCARASYIQNISLRTKGRILSSPYQAIDISKSDSEVFKSKLSSSYELGFSTGYRITPNVALAVEAFYRYMPGSVTTDSYGLTQKYNWTGLNASLNYLF